jgi:hypothetical protein
MRSGPSRRRGPRFSGHGTQGDTALDMTHLANLPKGGTTNSDLAFWGNLVYAGNYHGFRIIDASNPSAPQVLSDFPCEGAQSDVGVWDTGPRRLLFLSIDRRQTQPECSTPDPTRAVGWEGIRIFDVTNPRNPTFVKAVATDCGSHTHTVVPDPENRRVLLYVSSYPLTEQGITEPDDPETDSECVPNHFKISVVEVPYSAPQDARVISQPSVAPADGCHDIGVFLDFDIAAAACLTEGQIWDISNRAQPRVVSHIVNPLINFWHSGAWTWDGRFAIFGDEEGGAAVTHGCTPAGTPPGFTWFYDRNNPSQPAGRFSQQRQQLTQGDLICTTHNYNPIPVLDRYMLASAFYEAGTGIVDFTDLANPREIAYFDAQGVDGAPEADTWSSYFYNDLVFANDIQRGVDIFRPLTAGLNARRSSSPTATLAAARRFGHLNPQTQELAFAESSATVACPSRTRSRRRRVGRGRFTIRATVTQQGRRVQGASVRARGPGFDRRRETNSRGEAVFRVRARRSGRATVSTTFCSGRLAARIAQGPRFTG